MATYSPPIAKGFCYKCAIMIEKNITDIIQFVKDGKVNPGYPGMALLQRLENAEFIKPHLIVFDFELNNLFFANKSATDFLGFETSRLYKYHEEFLENLLHPVSYQLLQLETRISKNQPDDKFSNIYCIKVNSKKKYAWVYASARVAGYTAFGVPKLIYICFIDVEKAVENHVRILNGSNQFAEQAKLKCSVDSLKTRELEILGYITSEYTSKEISDKLNITQAAVDAARKRLMQKLGVKSLIGLVKVAMVFGLKGHKAPEPPHILEQTQMPLEKRA